MDLAEKTVRIQTEAEERMQAWRQTRADTAGLKEYLHRQMQHELFNSAVLLRLNTEVLIYELAVVEADASFYAYVESQELALHTANSGAKAWPDQQTACVRLFGDMLTFVEKQGRAKAARVLGELQSRAEKLHAAFSPPDPALFAALLGRIAVSRAVYATNNDDFERSVKDAHTHLAALDDSADAEVLFSKALLYVLTRNVAEAFPFASAAVKQAPYNVRPVLLFVQVLSADDQPEAALKLSEVFFDAFHSGAAPRPLLLLDRIALLELKKTQIGLLAKLKETQHVINELLPFIELVADLFEIPADARGHNGKSSRLPGPGNSAVRSNPTPNGNSGGTPLSSTTSNHRLFSLHRRDTSSAANSLQSTSASSRSHAATATKRSRHDLDAYVVADSWLWISRLYANFGFDEEARGALREVEKSFGSSTQLDGYAQVHSMLGLLEAEQSPAKALAEYRMALQATPDCVAAGIGAAHILAEDDFELLDRDRELALAISSSLEAACQRSPARFSSEAWHARGLLAQKLGDNKDARDAFWRAVELEERRSITPYVYLI